MNKRLTRIDFTALRHKEFDLVNDFCEGDEDHMRWAVGDMWYDWQWFNEMKKDEVLILKIHKGGTHVFHEDKLKDYTGALNPSIYFKITCYRDRDGKPELQGYDFTIEPYEVEGD